MALNKIKSNFIRCPLLKITKKEYIYNEEGQIEQEIQMEEFMDCYKTFCMAWDPKKKRCTYFEEDDDSDDD